MRGNAITEDQQAKKGKLTLLLCTQEKRRKNKSSNPIQYFKTDSIHMQMETRQRTSPENEKDILYIKKGRGTQESRSEVPTTYNRQKQGV